MKRVSPGAWFLAGFILMTAFTVLARVHYHFWQGWATHWTGADDTAGPIYGYWSGFGSVFPWSLNTLVALWVIIWHHVRKTNCHVHRCWRIGSYPAGQYTVCKRHSREIVGLPTVQHIRLHHLLHVRAMQTQAGFPPKD
jgi:uncharacterized membrane protein